MGDNLSEPIAIERGVRQGCPASPTLFNIFINDILDKTMNIGVLVPGMAQRTQGLLYADDLVLLVESPEELHAALDRVHDCAAKWEMGFGIDICKVSVYFGDVEALRARKFTLGPHEVGVDFKYRYLGISVDSQWSIKRVIDEQYNVSRTALMAA